MVFTEAKTCSGHAHLDSGLAHSLEGVSTCFGGRTLLHQII
jgi:hypothetical protein